MKRPRSHREPAKILPVSTVSILRKLGIAARVARDQAGRNRTVSAVFSAVSTTLRSFGRAANQLWLEVTGTLFLSIAAFGVIALVREYSRYQAGHAPLSRVAVAVAFTLTFGWFGLSSFWKVRRKNERT